MQDELDSDTFEATLRFVEECAIETFGEISELTPSVTTLLSPSSELLPFDVASLVDESDQLPTETLATIPLPIPDATVTTDSRTTTRKRKSSRPRKPQANPNRARDEMKFELAYLREKSVQLEQELSHLQQQAQTNATSVVCRENVPTVVIVHHGESTQGLGVWEGIAGRQRKRREDAERENARLRLLLERQRKAAADLANLLRKRVVECARGKDPRAAEHQLSRVLDFHGDIDAFRDLFGHLESTYAEVDAVFAANGLATMENSTNDVHIREGVDGRYLEFFSNKIMPFGLRDTAEAAWDHFKGVEKHFGNGGIYEKAAKNLDQPYTIVEDFTKELHSNYARADMKAKQIVRRYVEADRDMIVFVSSVTPVEIKHKAIAGLTYHLRGYAVTKRSSASDPDHELSLLQFCSRVSIDKEPGVEYNPDHARAVVRFIVGNMVGNIRSYQERIENALVDQALRR